MVDAQLRIDWFFPSNLPRQEECCQSPNPLGRSGPYIAFIRLGPGGCGAGAVLPQPLPAKEARLTLKMAGSDDADRDQESGVVRTWHCHPSTERYGTIGFRMQSVVGWTAQIC